MPMDIFDDLIGYANMVKIYIMDTEDQLISRRLSISALIQMEYVYEDNSPILLLIECINHVEIYASNENLTCNDNNDISGELTQHSLTGVHVRDELYEMTSDDNDIKQYTTTNSFR
ncbi:unnamed protein product [Adineta steineri]|uniref:Uncharacterized protein n=1 Tax=Adineta steineri TaxID=433720 RepID=A0A819ZQR9_9BILA|nr:unnamed protein product [Adineta steineri]CAF3497606.1 unnamed protein product [Adineta steineri]CAF4177977.1 unnamed protein product [Adineta steineri]